jgi:hypothetical protein
MENVVNLGRLENLSCCEGTASFPPWQQGIAGAVTSFFSSTCATLPGHGFAARSTEPSRLSASSTTNPVPLQRSNSPAGRVINKLCTSRGPTKKKKKKRGHSTFWGTGEDGRDPFRSFSSAALARSSLHETNRGKVACPLFFVCRGCLPAVDGRQRGRRL